MHMCAAPLTRTVGLMQADFLGILIVLQDITYKYAKRGSMAAAVSWKWVLLVLAERRMDDSEAKASEAVTE